MSPLTLMLLLFYECFTGASVRPVVSFSPNWATVFYGDSVTLTCNLDPNPEKEMRYFWYRNNEKMNQYDQSIKIQSDRWKHNWNYQCQAGTSDKSDAVRLDISNDLVILQAPPSIREGDSLSLRCHSRLENNRGKDQFYKNGNLITTLASGSVYSLGNAAPHMTGTYKCAKLSVSSSVRNSKDKRIYVEGAGTKPVVSIKPQRSTALLMNFVTLTCIVTSTVPERWWYVWYKDGDWIPKEQKTFTLKHVQEKDSGNYQCQTPGSERSDPVRLDVEWELFNILHIKVNPGDILEGDHVTITCDIELSPHRETTELQFVFYRNGHNVQGFSLSNQYGVPSAQLEDSGNYTCEVQTPTGSVRKMSSVLHLLILELFSTPQITVDLYPWTEGDQINITCDTKLSPHRETTELQFVFYRNGHNVQGFNLSNQYGVPSAQLKHSGNYTCEVQTPTGSVRKRSNMTLIWIQDGNQTGAAQNTVRLVLSGVIFIIILCLLFYHKKTMAVTYSQETEENGGEIRNEGECSI